MRRYWIFWSFISSLFMLKAISTLPKSAACNSTLWPAVKAPTYQYESQSPTNIDTSRASPSNCLSPICIYRTTPLLEETVIITNTGHYLEIHLEDEAIEKKPYISGGPLFSDRYLFEQMHFHWGADDDCGSEHYVNGKCYSMETHMVFVNEKYSSFDEAKNHYDGVTVIAFFGEVSEHDNPEFTSLVNKVLEVEQPHSETTGLFVNELRYIRVLFEQDQYYSFPGSLTTPNYEECVTWIVFTNPFRISSEQINAFRQLIKEDGEGKITENHRELQEFDDRPFIYPVINRHIRICSANRIHFPTAEYVK